MTNLPQMPPSHHAHLLWSVVPTSPLTDTHTKCFQGLLSKMAWDPQDTCRKTWVCEAGWGCGAEGGEHQPGGAVSMQGMVPWMLRQGSRGTHLGVEL